MFWNGSPKALAIATLVASLTGLAGCSSHYPMKYQPYPNKATSLDPEIRHGGEGHRQRLNHLNQAIWKGR